MVLQSFSTPARGLSSAEAAVSRRKHGTNELPQQERRGFWRQFLAGFGDPIIKILLAALLINFLITFRGEGWFETVGIAAAVFLATFVSALSEYGSEAAFAKLQKQAAQSKCRVKRDDMVVELSVDELVYGDIVLIGAGERLPADGLLISGALTVDQSALTGESREVKKTPGEPDPGEREWETNAPSLLFRGSVVTAGDGIMRVLRVGGASQFGKMAASLGEAPRESPLRLRMATLANAVSRLGYIAAILVFCASIFNNLFLSNGLIGGRILADIANTRVLIEYLLEAITLAITVIVVAVPEGLPMMITVVLSSNMMRMMKDNVMVRKLVGIETSGSLNILFTDKTGTLTRGMQTVTHIITSGGKSLTVEDLRSSPELCELLSLSGFYNTSSVLSGGRALGGNTTDRAMLNFALKLGSKPDGVRRETFLPFDSGKKLSAVSITGKRRLTLIKGAPEYLLPRCTGAYDEQGREIPFAKREGIMARMQEEARGGARILCVCTSDMPLGDDAIPSQLRLLCLAVMRDPPRKNAKASVERIRRAGVQVVMVTGDSLDTAAAIAREVSLADGEMLTGEQLRAMGDDQLLHLIPRLRVVARALPEDKTRLVRLTQQLGLVTGMTGDGINDAPALRLADVGFSMGSGTEVAREAGDIVILDDNIESISKAMLYGRVLFRSIQKFIIFQLTMNFCAATISIIAPLIGVNAPVTVMQMLWINIIMDTFAGLAFAGEAPLAEYMEEPPKSRTARILTRDMANQIALTGLFTVILCMVFLKAPFVHDIFRPHPTDLYFMTGFFAFFIFAGIFNCFSARTPKVNLFSGLSKNRAFIIIMCLIIVIQLGMIYFGGEMFRAGGLTPRELAFVVFLAFLVIPFDICRKLIVRHMRERKKATN